MSRARFDLREARAASGRSPVPPLRPREVPAAQVDEVEVARPVFDGVVGASVDAHAVRATTPGPRVVDDDDAVSGRAFRLVAICALLVVTVAAVVWLVCR